MIASLTRRRFLSHAAAVPVLAARAADRPNIILCMGDDHGWNETAYNGHPYVHTPVLDDMAATGMRFDRFYAAAPVCSPTRASVMTGRHPNRCGTFNPNFSTRPEEITVAHVLRNAGYACGHFGKWHLGPVKASSPTSPGAMGFEEWLSHDNFFELDPQLSRNGGPPEQIKGESSEIVVNEALRFINRAARSQRPFFTVIWFGSPHAPYVALDKDMALYREAPEALRGRFAEITTMDRAIGHLRQSLSRTGLRDNTLLWYCGDNGVPPEGRLTTPFRGHKGDIYEGGLRVPGIIEWPARIPKPLVVDVSAVTSDMLPTLCDITGQPLPQRPLDGISLKPLFEGGLRERPRPICFWQFRQNPDTIAEREPYIAPELQEGTTPTAVLNNGKLTRSFRNYRYPRVRDEGLAGPAAILDNDHKLVFSGKSPQPELYDVRKDRGETTNLGSHDPKRVQTLERQLRNWQRSVLTSLTGADYKK